MIQILSKEMEKTVGLLAHSADLGCADDPCFTVYFFIPWSCTHEKISSSHCVNNANPIPLPLGKVKARPFFFRNSGRACR